MDLVNRGVWTSSCWHIQMSLAVSGKLHLGQSGLSRSFHFALIELTPQISDLFGNPKFTSSYNGCQYLNNSGATHIVELLNLDLSFPVPRGFYEIASLTGSSIFLMICLPCAQISTKQPYIIYLQRSRIIFLRQRSNQTLASIAMLNDNGATTIKTQRLSQK